MTTERSIWNSLESFEIVDSSVAQPTETEAPKYKTEQHNLIVKHSVWRLILTKIHLAFAKGQLRKLR